MRLQDFNTDTRCTATVVSSLRITSADSPDEVREIVLEVPQAQFEVTALSTIGVLAPADPAFGHDHHIRLYTVADLPHAVDGGKIRFPICVRRCTYIDDYSGEKYRGIASNYLCDLSDGNTLTLSGPYEHPFTVPDDPEAALILIGAGTGIAPFRAFVRHLYEDVPEFKGQIKLFHGGRTGLEMLYRNDVIDDFTQYYDQETFEAIEVLSARPHWSDAIDWGSALEGRSEEIWRLLSDPHTRVYVAGLEPIRHDLDAALAELAGSPEAWAERKAELKADGRWVELLY